MTDAELATIQRKQDHDPGEVTNQDVDELLAEVRRQRELLKTIWADVDDAFRVVARTVLDQLDAYARAVGWY